MTSSSKPALRHHIFLTGMPGCGKTTLGRALKKRGYDFVDLDECIEADFGLTVAQLIASRGMADFRRLESATLRRLVAGSPCIIGCGGGTPCHDGNMELMLQSGTCVLLRCDRDRHVRRIAEAGAQRPMFADICTDQAAIATRLDELQARRAPYYSQAHLVFDTTRLETVAEVADTVTLFIGRVLAAETNQEPA